MIFQRILPALGLGLMLALAGCKTTTPIIDRTGSYDLSALHVDFSLRSERSVAVAVIDSRPYVLSGEQYGTFLGTERSRWGGEKAMGTASGRPLAAELGAAIARTLNWRGVRMVELPAEALADETAARAAFAASGADRLLVLRLQEWRTDIYTRIELRWRMEVAVADAAGAELGWRLSQGKEPLGSSALETDYSVMVVDALSARLSDLVGYPTIVDALK